MMKRALRLLVCFALLSILCNGCSTQQGSRSSSAEADASTSVDIMEPSSAVGDHSELEPTPESLPEPEPEPTPEPPPEPVPEPTPEPAPIPGPTLPLEHKIICIDPGHCISPLAGKGYMQPVSPLSDEQKSMYGRGTQGANMSEVELTLIVGLKLRDALEELGAEVLMTREVSEITISLMERCDIANEAGADIKVSIHADGNNDHSIHGVSVLVPAADLLGTPEIREESVRLGELMVDAVADKTGARNRGAIPRKDLTGFNFSTVPTVLIEMGFMTNKEEDALLETEEYQDKIVAGMVDSLLEWYGVNEVTA